MASNLQGQNGYVNLGGNNTFTGGAYIAGTTQVVLTSPTALGGGQSTPVYNALTMGSNVVWIPTLSLNGNSISLASLNTTTAVDVG